MSALRRIWIPGVQYAGETTTQMLEREQRWRDEDACIDAEEKRLAAWKARPWWEAPPKPDALP